MKSSQKQLKNLNHQARIKRLRRLLATGTAVAALATVSFNKTQVHADEVQKGTVKQSTPEPVGDGTAPATHKSAAASATSSDRQTSSSSAASASSESSTDKTVNDHVKADQSSPSSTSASSVSDTSSTNASSAASETSSSAASKTDAQTTSSADTENQPAVSSSSSTESDTPTSATATTSATESKAASALSDSAKTESANTDTESSAKATDASSAQNTSSAESQRKTNANTTDSKHATETKLAKDPIKVDNRKTAERDVNADAKTASATSKAAQKATTSKTKTTQPTIKATKTPVKQHKFAVYAADENPVNVANLTSTQINFLNSIKDAAINGWDQYGVLPSLTAAQAILESGWGQSSLATQYHNLFGIKGNYHGQTVNLPTQEYVHGKYVTIGDYFRVYRNNGESLADHSQFLVDNSRYANLLKVKNSNTVTRLISQDGYATAPNYTAFLRELISEYKLNDWDTLAFSSNNNTQTTIVTPTPTDNTKTETHVVNTYYTVRSGDTLTAISTKYHTTNATLIAWNNIKNPNLIYVGTSLIVAKTAKTTVVSNTPEKRTTPAKTTTTTVNVTYTVKSGDNLSGIAAKYDTTVPVLVNKNHIKNANLITVGQVLVVGTRHVTTTVNTSTTAKPATTTNTSAAVKTKAKTSARPAAKPAAASATYYTVKAGDNLSGIAAKYNTNVKTLAINNRIANTNVIYIGQVLLVKGATSTSSHTARSAKTTSSRYTVKSGDTLWALANRNNTTINQLKRRNGLTSDTIYIGQKLKLN